MLRSEVEQDEQDDQRHQDADTSPGGAARPPRKVGGCSHVGWQPTGGESTCGRQGRPAATRSDPGSPMGAGHGTSRQRHPAWAGGYRWPVGNGSPLARPPARALSSQSGHGPSTSSTSHRSRVPSGVAAKAPRAKALADVVGRGLLDALGLPLPVGGAERLDQDGGVVVVAVGERLLESPAQRLDDGLRPARRPGRRGRACRRSRRSPAESTREAAKAAPALAALSSRGRPGLGETLGVGVARGQHQRRGRRAPQTPQSVEQVVLLVLQRPLELAGQVGLDGADGLVPPLQDRLVLGRDALGIVPDILAFDDRRRLRASGTTARSELAPRPVVGQDLAGVDHSLLPVGPDAGEEALDPRLISGRSRNPGRACPPIRRPRHRRPPEPQPPAEPRRQRRRDRNRMCQLAIGGTGCLRRPLASRLVSF